MDRSTFRRFIRRHFVALPLCILTLSGAAAGAVLATSGLATATDRQQMAKVIAAWHRAEALPYLVPAALVPQVERMWAAKANSKSLGGASSGTSPNAHVSLSASAAETIVADYSAAVRRYCAASWIRPPNVREQQSMLNTLRQELDLRGQPPLTGLSYRVTSISAVGRASAGAVVRVTAEGTETHVAGPSYPWAEKEDYQMTRAADGRWLIVTARSLSGDGSPAPSLVPWYWERWFLWTLAVELGLIAFFLAVKTCAEGTRPRASRDSRGQVRFPGSMVGSTDGSLPRW